MGFLNASDFNALRALAGQWREGWISGRFASQLDIALDEIAARRRSGPGFLDAYVYGDSIPELRAAALAEAMALWGEKADPAVEGVGTIENSSSPRGRFSTCVHVRCVNYAEISS